MTNGIAVAKSKRESLTLMPAPLSNSMSTLPWQPIWLVLVASILALASSASAQVAETFDGSQTSWTRHESDCQISGDRWEQRRTVDVQRESGIEQIRFQCGNGTRVLVAHPVTPAFVIDELGASLRIRGTHRGVRIGVRVVLPHTPSPAGDGPMSTILFGPATRGSGAWETLAFGRTNTIHSLLKTELWMLRGEFGPDVTLRDAYVDRVVLNLYTHPGSSLVETDDLRLSGVVDASAVANDRPVSETTKPKADLNVMQASAMIDIEKQPALARRDGTLLMVRQRPFFPRVIEYNGEPLEFLQSLGFNTIELRTPPTDEQLKQAAALDLWFIAPPPNSVGLSPIGFKFDPVLAWSLGRHLTDRDLDSLPQRVREIRESDQRENRPLIANADSHWSQIAAPADVLSLGREPIGSSMLASRYGDWLERNTQSIRSTKPFWADVQTQTLAAVSQQAAATAGTVPPTPVEFQQLRFLSVEALRAGARGLRFLSRSPLNQNDPATRLRALSIEYTNRWLSQIEPWVVGGVVMGQLSTSDSSQRVTAINTNRARLLLVQRPTHLEQFWAGDVPVTEVNFTDADSVFTSRVYQLTDVDLKPLPSTRLPSGTGIRIPDCPMIATVVMTDDSLVTRQLLQSFDQPGEPSMWDMHSQLTTQWLAIEQLISREMAEVGQRTAAQSGWLNEAVIAVQSAAQQTGMASTTTAQPLLDRADQRLAMCRREMQSGPLNQFASKTSSPLLSHASLVPSHWRLANQLSIVDASINSLAGGDFENLDLMKRSGWENQRTDETWLQAGVQLAREAAREGVYGLRMSVASSRGNAAVESTPLTVSSPSIDVPAQRLVRVHGWVNVPQTIAGSEDGLIVRDSVGGGDLCERIPVTNGWREFTLYRATDSDTPFRVQFQMTGIGVAMVDEVTIQVTPLP